jgi:hypothetical protein
VALTRAQLILIEGMGEEEWTRFVKSRAHHWDWYGVHVRYSQGVIESIHTVRVDGFSEAYGMPDWYFWSEGLAQHFYAELKGASGHLSKEQKAMIPSLRQAGEEVFVWFPKDAEVVEQVFQYGLAA